MLFVGSLVCCLKQKALGMEDPEQELPQRLAIQRHANDIAMKSLVFILDPLNCFISKITSLLFTSTMPDKG